jgi:AcrR family transcriptional regulator
LSTNNPEQRRLQQAAQSVIKRLLEAPADLQSVADSIEGMVAADLSGTRTAAADSLETLIQLFLAARDQLPQAAQPGARVMPLLCQALQSVAQLHGISPDYFYPALLGRIFADLDTGETATAPPKISTKERILEAALEVFSDKGFFVATVDEIAEQAGVGKGTLYRYFANKEALFNELVRIRLEELEQRTIMVLNAEDDVISMITKYLRVYFEFFDHNQRLYRVIVQEHLDFGDQMQDLYIKKVMRRVPILKRKIYEATQLGVFKDVDFQTVFYGVMGFIHGVIQKWLAHDCSYSLLSELPTVVETLFFGFVRNQDHGARQNLEGASPPARNVVSQADAGKVAAGNLNS